MVKQVTIMGLFNNFEQAFAVVADIRSYIIPGVSVDDVTIQSPIEHPEVEEVLGERPVYVQKFSFAGSLFGLVFGFIFLAAAQGGFFALPLGGKAVVPLPSNLVLNYELLIMFGVLATLVGFIIGARLLRKKNAIYSEKVSLDQVAILIDVDKENLAAVKDLFKQHKAVELREEIIS